MITKFEEINPKEKYYTDGNSIYKTVDDYCKHIEENYEGIKDELEGWLDIQVQENLEEKEGKKILEELLLCAKEVVKKIEMRLEDGRN